MRVVNVAACALVDADGRVLVTQRPQGKAMAGLWEFPGGKVEDDEAPEAALVREMAEELGVEIGPRCLTPLGFASHAYEDFHLVMLLYACRRWEGIATGREGQALRWVHPRDLRKLEMPPADKPLIHMLIDHL